MKKTFILLFSMTLVLGLSSCSWFMSEEAAERAEDMAKYADTEGAELMDVITEAFCKQVASNADVAKALKVSASDMYMMVDMEEVRDMLHIGCEWHHCPSYDQPCGDEVVRAYVSPDRGVPIGATQHFGTPSVHHEAKGERGGKKYHMDVEVFPAGYYEDMGGYKITDADQSTIDAAAKDLGGKMEKAFFE